MPRFVKNSVWSITDSEVEWKLVNSTSHKVYKSNSVADSQGSSCSSDVRSFRIPTSSFKRRYSSRSEDGKKLVPSPKTKRENKIYRRVKSVSNPKVGANTHTDNDIAADVQSDPPSGVCTPISSPIKRGKLGPRYSQWEPKMSRITSGRELDSLNISEETVARKLGALPEQSHVIHGDLQECPLSPAASIDSTNSFSRSVSDYVDSWLQSLKSGISVPGSGDLAVPEGSQTPQRSSLDGHGAHRHYTRGSVAATNQSLIPFLEKYALESQLCAKSKSALTALPSRSYPGHVHSHQEISAIDSIGLDGDCPDSIRKIVTDEHLLQFGDLIGEGPCAKLLKDLSIEQACDSVHSLFGPQENISLPWEKSACGTTEGIDMIVERRLLRNGLYMYKTDVIIHGLEPHDIRPFHLDDQARSLWDDSAILCKREIPPGETRISKHAESCLQRYVSRFPRPLSARRYEYARRVWTRPCDGGCYAISRSCSLPHDPSLSKKFVLVQEYISACLIKSNPKGTQITTVYFEDSQVRAGLAKMAVPKGLWPFWTKYETSLRFFAKAKQVNTSQRRSLDGALPANQKSSTTISCRQITNNEDCVSEYDSDDEVYDALARIKADKRNARHTSGAADLPRLVRRVLVAGAIKLVHESIRK